MASARPTLLKILKPKNPLIDKLYVQFERVDDADLAALKLWEGRPGVYISEAIINGTLAILFGWFPPGPIKKKLVQ